MIKSLQIFLSFHKHNNIVVSVIPNLIDTGGPWRVLPSGIHSASFSEIEVAFATTLHRQNLYCGFRSACIDLRRAGCRLVYLDGSFVTNKEVPGDYDACWCSEGVNPDMLDPLFLDYDNSNGQKAKYKGEFYLNLHQPYPGTFFVEYFQKDKLTGGTKGILSVDLAAPIPLGLST